MSDLKLGRIPRDEDDRDRQRAQVAEEILDDDPDLGAPRPTPRRGRGPARRRRSSSCSRADEQAARLSRPRVLRVIAGSIRGRRLVVAAGRRVRPTKDIVREACSPPSTPRGAIVDARVLDLYAGTGALGDRGAVAGRRRARARRARPGRARRHRPQPRARSDSAPAHACRCGRRRQLPRRRRRPRRRRSTWCSPIRRTTRPTRTSTALLAALTAPGWLAPDALIVRRATGPDPSRRSRTGSEPAGSGPSAIRSCSSSTPLTRSI